MTLEEAKKAIKEPDQQAMELCKRRWDSIAKPLHSLGKLEDNLVKIAGITGSADIHLEKKALVTMCADNGVVEEGVTQTGQEVTAVCDRQFPEQKGHGQHPLFHGRGGYFSPWISAWRQRLTSSTGRSLGARRT